RRQNTALGLDLTRHGRPRFGHLSGDSENWSGDDIENWSPQRGGEDGTGLEREWLPAVGRTAGGGDAEAGGGRGNTSVARSWLGDASDRGAARVQPDDGAALCLGWGVGAVSAAWPVSQAGRSDRVVARAAEPASWQRGRGAPGPGTGAGDQRVAAHAGAGGCAAASGDGGGSASHAAVRDAARQAAAD